MKITFTDKLTGTPARVNRLTGEIFLNSNVWGNLPEAYQKFIIEHEKGHFLLKTTSEHLADHYAFVQLAGKEKKSLKNMVRTLADVLPGHTNGHKSRILNIYRLCLEYDLNHNKRAKTKRELQRVNSQLSVYPQIKKYKAMLSKMRKGSPGDYDITDFSREMFEPSVGRRFLDVPMKTMVAVDPASGIEETVLSKPFQTSFERNFGRKVKRRFQKQGNAETPIYRMVSVSPEAEIYNDTSVSGEKAVRTLNINDLPDYKLPFQLDFKTLLIVALAFLVFIGLKKL